MGNKLFELIRTDLIKARRINHNDKLDFFKLFFYFFSSRTFRIHTFVRLRSGNRLIAFIAKLYLDRFFIEIGRKTKIGSHFFMPHPRCIIIANNVQLGQHVQIGQYVTLGGNFKKNRLLKNGEIQKLPIIGDRVNILAGAVVGGPVQIENNVIVGANSVVTKDVPSNSVVVGQNQIAKNKIKLSEDGGSYKSI